MVILYIILISTMLGLFSFGLYMIKYNSYKKKLNDNIRFLNFKKSHHAGMQIMLMISIIPIIGVLINMWGLIELFAIKE